MTEVSQVESAAESFGSRGLSLVIVLLPLAIAGALLITGTRFQLPHERVVRFLPYFLVFSMLWVFALLRLFWPERMPTRLSHDSPRLKRLVWIKRGAWAAAVAFMVVDFIADWDPNNLLGIAGYVCVTGAVLLSGYVRLRSGVRPSGR